MSISACWIVKNEEQNIAKSIMSVKNCVDELIVVDTGSSDNTVRTAKDAGASTWFHKWNDDFSAARNYALSLAQGEFVIFLDADEFFTPPLCETDSLVIQNRFEETKADVLHVLGSEIDEETMDILGTHYFEVILRRSTVHYENRVHELPMMKDGSDTVFYPLLHYHITHTGYSTNKLSGKLKRNIAMLEKERNLLTDGYKLFLNRTYLMRDAYINEEFEKSAGACKHLLDHPVHFPKAFSAYPDLYKRELFVLIELAGMFPSVLTHKKTEYYINGPLTHRLLNTRELIIADLYFTLLCAKDEKGFFERLENLEKDLDGLPESSIPECVKAEASIYQKASEIAFYAGNINRAEFYAMKAVDCDRPKKVSACWIVKNEAENIRESVMSVAECADELIVVDTGSTDETIRIAEECGAAVYHYKWNDDFSAAKNYAMSLSSGDYVIFIDGDEYFSPSLTQADKARFLAVFRETKADVLYIYRSEIEKEDGTQFDIQAYERILRKSSVHFENRVHEVPRLSGGEIPIGFILEDYLLCHTGYSKDIIRNKAVRNLKILESEHQRLDDPLRQFMNAVYLMRENYVIGEYAKAADYFTYLLARYGHFKDACKHSPYGYLTHFYQAAHLGELMRFRFNRRELYDKLFGAIKENYAYTRDALLADLHYQLRFDYREERFLHELELLEPILNTARPADKDCRYIESKIFERAAEAQHRRGDREKTCLYALHAMKYDRFLEGRPLLYLLYAIKDLSSSDTASFLSGFDSAVGRPDTTFAVAELKRFNNSVEQLFNNASTDDLQTQFPRPGVEGANSKKSVIKFKYESAQLFASMRYGDIISHPGAAFTASENHEFAFFVAYAHLLQAEYDKAYQTVQPHIITGALHQNLLGILLVIAEKAQEPLAAQARKLYKDSSAMHDEGIDLSDVINTGVVYGADTDYQTGAIEKMTISDFETEYKKDQNRPVTGNLLEAHKRAVSIFEKNGCALMAAASYRLLLAKRCDQKKNAKGLSELFGACGNHELSERISLFL